MALQQLFVGGTIARRRRALLPSQRMGAPSAPELHDAIVRGRASLPDHELPVARDWRAGALSVTEFAAGETGIVNGLATRPCAEPPFGKP